MKGTLIGLILFAWMILVVGCAALYRRRKQKTRDLFKKVIM